VTFRIITVSVVDLPTVTIGNVEYRGSVGREITLECDVVSDPPETTVYWRRIVQGELSDIDTSLSKYTRTSPSSPSLTIIDLESSDAGTYQCFADNEVGSGSSEDTSLRILCKLVIIN
jgi:hypothetical protein